MLFVICYTADSVVTPMSASKANRSALSSGKKGSTASPDGKAKRGSVAPFIPFAQRQARSQVAAHETLKRGKNVRQHMRACQKVTTYVLCCRCIAWKFTRRRTHS
jgi:hypothetical protein